MIITYAIGMVVLAYPMLRLLEIPNIWIFLVVQIVGCLFIGLVSATQSAAYCEMTPSDVRTTVMGVPYNLSSALVGGTMPLIATALVGTGHGPNVAFIIMGIALFGGIVVFLMPEPNGRDLNTTTAQFKTIGVRA